ncbi:glutathione S-transferase [Kockovaella imperatae]|uniref:Glutathione S-transferase n=1 Tax=Kockovaella imperatae TaxID=4999 RepID=A0A1Y1U8Q2_9TREE|nr:glutathione S-transferase [Kockovaella imperatae]ORX33924.1 glutathione S-transferase [Kockovaella imperatae]
MPRHPDEDNHPVATGLAKKLVDAHQARQDLVFWSAWFCPFNQRIWMALEERNIPYQYHEVNPYKKEKDFLEVNPLGLVPALTDKGRALYESDVLVEYLEDKYPPSKEHPPIFPTDIYEKSWARINIQHITKDIIPHYFKLQQAQETEDQQQALEEFYKGLRTLVDRVKLPYFAGEQFTAVDMSLAPFVRRFYSLEEHRGFDGEKALGSKWVQDCHADIFSERESLKNTTSEKEYYAPLLERYLKDEAQSEVAKATRSGKKLP